jgi:CheY-like chemotaxis protein
MAIKKGVPILVVEDDEVDVGDILRAFKKNKITNPIYVASNGEEALAFLRHEGPYSDRQDKTLPGIILLDINMPIMNGIEFLRIIKADSEFKTIPVIVLTTSKEDNDRLESFRLSVAGYIIKPVDFEKFVEAVKTFELYWTLSEML